MSRILRANETVLGDLVQHPLFELEESCRSRLCPDASCATQPASN